MKGYQFVIVSLGVIFLVRVCTGGFFFVGRLFVECNYANARIILFVWVDSSDFYQAGVNFFPAFQFQGGFMVL